MRSACYIDRLAGLIEKGNEDMARQTGEKTISQGICHFCHGEFAKNKMTQHLKSCKARSAKETSQEGQETRLLHVQIEGKYRPEYWMHVEIPAEATLADLDDFLRAVWVECCDHLSEFTIGGVSYSSASDDGWMGGLTLLEEGEDEDDDEDEEHVHEHVVNGLSPTQDALPPLTGPDGMASWLTEELRKTFQTDLQQVPASAIEQKLEQMFTESLPAGLGDLTMASLKPMLKYMAEALQAGTLAEELEEFEQLEEDEEEGGMDIELGEALSVGDRFSYVYDFGSSTTLALRVIAEREGAMLQPTDEELEEDEEDEEDEEELAEDGEELSITLLAFNEPPALVCHVCQRQPAAYISSVEEFMPVAEAVFCKDCAQKQDYPDELLPVVNSPRVGICGYTGDYEGEEFDGFEDEDEDEE
jgi:hypothetical protein